MSLDLSEARAAQILCLQCAKWPGRAVSREQYINAIGDDYKMKQAVLATATGDSRKLVPVLAEAIKRWDPQGKNDPVQAANAFTEVLIRAFRPSNGVDRIRAAAERALREIGRVPRVAAPVPVRVPTNPGTAEPEKVPGASRQATDPRGRFSPQSSVPTKSAVRTLRDIAAQLARSRAQESLDQVQGAAANLDAAATGFLAQPFDAGALDLCNRRDRHG